jgi:hypothetical protein
LPSSKFRRRGGALPCRVLVRGWWRHRGRVYVLTWMGFDCDDIQRLRRGIRHLLSDRLWRGQRVRGRIRTARSVYL